MQPIFAFAATLALLSSTLAAQSMPAFITGQFPQPGATNVARNSLILLRYQQGADTCTLIRLTPAGGTALSVAGNYGDFQVGAVELIFTPSSPLLPSTTYTVTPQCSTHSWKFDFTTGAEIERIGPRITGVTPDPEARDTSPFGPFTIQFDKPLLSTRGVFSLSTGAGYAFNSFSATLSADRSAVAIRPVFENAVPPVLVVSYDATAVRDFQNNPGAGTSTSFRFLTSLVSDASGPQLLATYPDAGDPAVPTNAAIQLLFDRPVGDPSARPGAITVEARGAVVPARAETSGRLVTLTGLTLLPSTTYRVTTTSALLDSSGIPSTTGSSFEFTTSNAPDSTTADDTTTQPRGDSIPFNTILLFRSPHRLPSFLPRLITSVGHCPTYSHQDCTRLAVSTRLLEDARTLLITPLEPLPAWASIVVAIDPIRDITGTQFNLAFTFNTSATADHQPPRLVASAPFDGESATPLKAPFRFLFDELISAATPSTAARLVKDGQTVPATFAFDTSYDSTGAAARAIHLTPSSPLEPGASYQILLNGVLDLAGNPSPAHTIAFQTTSDTSNPGGLTSLLSSSLDSASPGPFDPIVLQYSRAINPARTTVTANVSVSRQFDSTLYFPHPIRVEVAGSTLTVTPLAAWPSDRNTSLTVYATDRSGGYISSYSAVFKSKSDGDTSRPEILSVSPAPGTPIGAGQTITLTFSKPMLSASQYGGITLLHQGAQWTSTLTWSDDRTSVVILPRYLFGGAIPSSADPLFLAVSSTLVDLSGNSVKALTASFPLIPSGHPGLLRNVLSARPESGASSVDPRSPISLYLSGPIDDATLNRALWVVSPLGRAAGAWSLSSGSLATFLPSSPLPASTAFRIVQVEPVISFPYGYAFSTALARPTSLAVVRTSLLAPHPADAVIEIELSQEPPAGPSLFRLQTGNYSKTDLDFDQQRPRPNVVRLVPRSALTPGQYLTVSLAPGAPLTWSGWMDRIAEPLKTLAAETSLRAPSPAAASVPLNAHISAVFPAALNPLSILASRITLSSAGSNLAASISYPTPALSLTVTPLAMLPPNSTIDVSIAGLEDRLGRPIPALSWSFTTSDSIDLNPPRLIFSNANSAFDPESSLLLSFDKPLDPAHTSNLLPSSEPFQLSFSDDLRSVFVNPTAGWRRGESYNLSAYARDWCGNQSSGGQISIKLAFDPVRTPPTLRAVSFIDGQAGVPLIPTFTLLFDRPLSTDSLRSVRLSSEAGEIPLTFKSASGNRVTLAPASLLPPLTPFQLIVEAVRDSAGNLMQDRTTLSFTTGEELYPPGAISTFRFDSVSSPLTIRFSQPIDVTPLIDQQDVLSANDWRGGTGYTIPVPATVGWSADRTVLTITPASPLTLGTPYRILLPGAATSFGASLAGSSIEFTPPETVDRSPIRVSLSPADSSSSVPLNVIMQVHFSRTPPSFPAVRLYEGSAQITFSVNSSFSGYTLPNLLNLQRTLKPNSNYRIEVDSFRDEFDNEIPASTASFSTAGAADSSSPRHLSTTPGAGEAGVSTESPCVFTFSLPLSPVAYFYGSISSSRKLPFGYTFATNGPRYSITPQPAWPAASTITVNFYPISSTRLGATSWTGAKFTQSIYTTFRTAAVNDPTPPVLESIDPPAGSTIPGGRSIVTLRFSKPVIVTPESLQIFYGAVKSGLSGVYSPDARKLTFNLESPANSRVTFLGTSDIRDNADNPLAPFVLEYDTGEALPLGRPSASLTEPAPYSTAPPDTKITVRFDRVMDAASVLASLRVTENGRNTAGAIDVLEAGRAYRFTPSAPFAAGSAVRVFILDAARDPEGRSFTPSYEWPRGFTIAAASTTLPALEIARRGFRATAPADSTLELAFNAELDAASVNGDSVWLRRGSALVPGEASLRDGAIVQFRPSAPLQPGVTYTLTAGSALRDLHGNFFPGQDLTFRATPPSPSNADLESVSEVQHDGRRAFRVRFSAPVSPLAVHGLALDASGSPVPAQALGTTDPREFLLIPIDAAPPSSLHVNLLRVPDSNGRILPFRRTHP